MKNITIKRILELKHAYKGIEEGFEFLDSFLLKKESYIDKAGKDLLPIYDYKLDATTIINCNLNHVYNMFYFDYLEFIANKMSKNTIWFCKFYSCVFSFLIQRTNEINSKIIISLITKTFCFLLHPLRYLNINLFKQILRNDFVFYMGSEGEIIASDIYNLLLQEKDLFKIIDDSFVEIEDKFFLNHIYSLALKIPNMYCEDLYAIKYSTEFNLNNLTNSLIDFVLYASEHETYRKLLCFFKQEFPMLHDLAVDFSGNTGIKTLPVLSSFNQGMFHSMYIRSLFLNEYCFQSIITSWFENYYYVSHSRNMLLERIDPTFYLVPAIEKLDWVEL